MREIFKPAEGETQDPGRVFYTITAEDVGKVHITTTIGPIEVGAVIGRVQQIDVGKRLYRVPTDGGLFDSKITSGQPVSWIWQCENNEQRDRRLARTEEARS